jgi:integrase
VSTIDVHWRKWIKPALGSKKVRSIKPSDVRALHRTLEQAGLAPRTRSAVHRSLAMALKAAEDEGLILSRPRVRAPKVNDEDKVARAAIPTAAEVDEIIARWPERLRAFPAVVAGAGLRPAECAGLTWNTVDLDGRVIHVEGQLVGTEIGPPKTEQSRRDVGIDDQLVAVLREHRRLMIEEARVDPDVEPLLPGTALVFTSGAGGPLTRSRGGPLTRSRIGEVWRSATAGLDLDDGIRGPHSLRHRFASVLLTEGVPVHEVARLMGHANGTVTLTVYAHVLRDKSDSDAIDRARDAIAKARSNNA